jgi:branched-chain amino acid aminotransferase
VIAVSIDGVACAPEQAVISIFDRGFLYGDGVFEVLRTWDGILVDLDAHLDRLYASAAWLGLKTMERAPLAEAVVRTVTEAGSGERRVRIVLTRGPGSLVARPEELGPGRAIVIAEPLPPQPTEVSLAIVDWPLPPRTEPAHKTLAYLDHIVARELAAAAGADEAVRLGPDGDVLECATSNVFAVVRGTVVTPPLAGVLPGTTRARVLAACSAAGIVVGERRLTVGELHGSDEIFISSALRGVVAVTRLDGRDLPAGPVTARVSKLYREEMSDKTVAAGPPSI